MKFEVGKYYSHKSGRQVSIVGEVKTTMWGKMMVVEEADATGHGISCAEFDSTVDINKHSWVEIGKEEWMKNFKEESCAECGAVFEDGSKYVPTPTGPMHPECFSRLVSERGPEIVMEQTIH